MTPPRLSLYERLLHNTASALVSSHVVPEVARATVVSVLDAQIRALVPPQRTDEDGRVVLRLCPRYVPAEQRQQRDAMVAHLLAAGTPAWRVAAQVGCSLSHVHRVRKRQAAQAAKADKAAAAGAAQCQRAP